jgi:hypothetical protein
VVTRPVASGTPVLATQWSGPAVFLTEQNSYPLRTDGLTPNKHAEAAAPDPIDVRGAVAPPRPLN